MAVRAWWSWSASLAFTALQPDVPRDSDVDASHFFAATPEADVVASAHRNAGKGLPSEPARPRLPGTVRASEALLLWDYRMLPRWPLVFGFNPVDRVEPEAALGVCAKRGRDLGRLNPEYAKATTRPLMFGAMPLLPLQGLAERLCNTQIGCDSSAALVQNRLELPQPLFPQ